MHFVLDYLTRLGLYGRMRSEKDHLRLIALEGIASHLRWLEESSMRLDHYLRLLVTRPDYETHASGEIEEVERAIIAALAKVREVKKLYYKKPVEN